MNKMRIYSCLSLLPFLLFGTCYMDVENDSDCCGFYVDNQSDTRIYVGFYFLSHLSEDGTVKPELNNPVGGYLGYVERNRQSNRFGLPYAKEPPAYGTFFETYGIDTLLILVTDDHNKIGKWGKSRNDTLLLKRYDITKDDVDTTKQDIYIKYP